MKNNITMPKKRMKIYRYESEDGGGLWCNLNGELRTNPTIKFDDEWCYGCKSSESLDNYFREQKISPKEYGLIKKVYSVPKREVIIEDKQILFPKKYVLDKRQGDQ